jgi:hypothetical protein
VSCAGAATSTAPAVPPSAGPSSTEGSVATAAAAVEAEPRPSALTSAPPSSATSMAVASLAATPAVVIVSLSRPFDQCSCLGGGHLECSANVDRGRHSAFGSGYSFGSSDHVGGCHFECATASADGARDFGARATGDVGAPFRYGLAGPFCVPAGVSSGRCSPTIALADSGAATLNSGWASFRVRGPHRSSLEEDHEGYGVAHFVPRAKL